MELDVELRTVEAVVNSSGRPTTPGSHVWAMMGGTAYDSKEA